MGDLLTLLGGHQAPNQIGGQGLGGLQGLLQQLMANSNYNRQQARQPTTQLMGTNQVPVQSNQNQPGWFDALGNYHSGVI